MMTFKLHLKRVKKFGHARIKVDLEKLKDPEVAEDFHAMTFNTAVTNTASEIIGKHRPVNNLWLTADLVDLCDKRRELKKKKNDVGVR